MKTLLVAAAVAATLAGGTASAQSTSEMAEIRTQLQQLMQRMDRLEQENASLKDENARLRNAGSVTKAPEVKAADVKAAPAADWPNRIALKGDVRYRHEQTDDEMASAERVRHLLRARLAIDAKVNDNFVAGIGFSTSENGNPRGANQTLDGEFSRKALDLDLAYFDWTVADGVHVIGGKMKMPFFRPGQSLFFDNDVNPEGLAFTYGRGMWFGSAYGYWIDENVPVTGTTATAADTMMYGAQFGARVPLGASNLTLAAMYYDLAAAQGRRPFYNNSANGNSLRGSGANAVLAYDFQVIELGAEFSTTLVDLPFQVWVDVAQNQAADLDTAYTIGTMFGKASTPGTWEAGLAYQLLEKDALFGQHVDSDFGNGMTDSAGWVLRAGYAPMRNWALNATYFLNERNRDAGLLTDYERLLVDFNVKF